MATSVTGRMETETLPGCLTLAPLVSGSAGHEIALRCPIDEPPFHGYELRPGVTFTYLGLKVDECAQVQGPDGAIENLWAAGEIMAGSILGQGYLAGIGMTIGAVFGRIAGQEAAGYVA